MPNISVPRSVPASATRPRTILDAYVRVLFVHRIRCAFLLPFSQSPGETQLRLARLHFSRVWHRLISLPPASFPAAPSTSEERLGESNPSVPSPVDSGSLHRQAPRPRDDCVEAALHAYRIAEHTLRRHQQVELLSPALFEQGNLLCVAGRPHMAAKAWSEAVDAAHRQMNVVSDKYLRADASATASGGPESDRGAIIQQRSIKSLSLDDATRWEQGSTGGYTGTTTRLALRSLLPLYFAARLGHFNALDYHLNAAQFAVQIVEKFFRISEPHPSRKSQFFRFRSDGRITRYRMREACPMLSDLQALFEEGEACVGGQNAKVFLAALQWFAHVLLENEINIQAAHFLLTLAEYVAADLCRHVRTALECRLKRTMLLLRYAVEGFAPVCRVQFILSWFRTHRGTRSFSKQPARGLSSLLAGRSACLGDPWSGRVQVLRASLRMKSGDSRHFPSGD